MKKPNLNQIKQNETQINKCKNTKQLAQLLKTTPREITLLSFEPLYYHFKIPKKHKGEFRFIEAPSIELKRLQRKLNKYLQSVYYLHQSSASYGYIIKPTGVKEIKNIYTNALQHLGNTYMLNADFKDFFHQITAKDVYRIFTGSLFNFDKNTANILAKICTYKDRLPMGAPTSPALSNLYSIGLDNDLNNWARLQNITYTRFVDDLSFSSKNTPITPQFFEQINRIALKYHLKFNTDKTTFFGKNDKKTVTGLVLNKTVDIDPDFYKELNDDIKRLHSIIEVQHITGKTYGLGFVKEFKQQVMGKINFIGMIEGINSPQYNEYQNKFIQAQIVSENLVSRWTKFNNYI